MLSTLGRPSHVLLRIEDFDRLCRQSGAVGADPEEPQLDPTGQHFTVLCRLDAWSHYVAQVDAQTAEEAARRACDNHRGYKWLHDGTHEFDARGYVTLDADGIEIESTKIGDF
jgi:hypothetical protein